MGNCGSFTMTSFRSNEANGRAWLHASTFLFVLILISATCGWFVPAFYDWTGADQSRPSPLMWQVPLAIAVGAFCFFPA
jgi:uncharacterized protein involved in response to NO